MAALDEHCGSDRVLARLFGLARTLPGRVRVSAAVTDGEPAIEILRHSRVIGADLLALGMHGRNGSMSPVIRAIIADPPCAVLAVPTFHHPRNTPGQRETPTILCCIDFRPPSLAAVGYALALARKSGAEVQVVHVLPESWDGPHRHDKNAEEAREFVEGDFRRLLQIAFGEAFDSTVRMNGVVVSGSPCVEIVRLATVVRPGLIVMGIDRYVEPPRADATNVCVMRFAPCPVLLVPFHAEKRRERARRAYSDAASGDTPESSARCVTSVY